VQVLRESSREAEKKVGLSGAQLWVVQKLAHESPLSLNELAARTATHQSSVSVVVSRLVELGVVRRAPSKEDARRVELTLTAKGRQLLAHAPAIEHDRLLDGLRRMNEEERATLGQGLTTWLAAIGLDVNEPQMFFEETSARRRAEAPLRTEAPSPSARAAVKPEKTEKPRPRR
jgi:DNA-binding MarR family transcriptional regulator